MPARHRPVLVSPSVALRLGHQLHPSHDRLSHAQYRKLGTRTKITIDEVPRDKTIFALGLEQVRREHAELLPGGNVVPSRRYRSVAGRPLPFHVDGAMSF